MKIILPQKVDKENVEKLCIALLDCGFTVKQTIEVQQCSGNVCIYFSENFPKDDKK